MWKRALAVVASLVVSGGVLWVALRDMPLGEVATSLSQANPLWGTLALVAGTVSIFTRGVRWRGLVNNRVSVRRAFYILGILQLMNLLPFRMGEVARAVLATREEIPLVTTASSVVIERLLDLIFVLMILAVVLPQAQDIPPTVARSVATFSALAGGTLAVLIVLARFPQVARRWLVRVQGWVPLLGRLPLESLLDQALEGLQPLTNRARFIHAAAWTVVSWGFSWAVFYLCQLALGVPPSALLFSLLSLALAAFAVAVPVTVAALGPFQAAVIVSGAAFGVANVLATAMGFLVHGLTIISYIIAGTAGFLGVGVSLADLTRQPAQDDPA